MAELKSRKWVCLMACNHTNSEPIVHDHSKAFFQSCMPITTPPLKSLLHMGKKKNTFFFFWQTRVQHKTSMCPVRTQHLATVDWKRKRQKMHSWVPWYNAVCNNRPWTNAAGCIMGPSSSIKCDRETRPGEKASRLGWDSEQSRAVALFHLRPHSPSFLVMGMGP